MSDLSNPIFQDAENGNRLWRGEGQVEKVDRFALLRAISRSSIGAPALPEELAGFRVFAFAQLFELLKFDDTLRESIRSVERTDDMRAIAQAMGMKFMQHDALQKILSGVTSIEEVARVVPLQTTRSSKCPDCDREISGSFKFCPHCGIGQQQSKANSSQQRSKMAGELLKRR